MANFFIRRPIVAMVISILLVLVGIASLMKLPVEQYPQLAPPNIQVTATYQGASAETVEQSVATPIEQQINGVDNMLYMRSLNSSDGRMRLDVTFLVGMDLDMACTLTQNRVAQAQSRLPQEVNLQGVTVKKVNPSMLMLVSIYSPKATYDELFLNNYAVLNVRDALLRVKGVSQVDLGGGSEYGMRIWLQPDRLARLGLTPADVINALKQQNIQAPSGQIGASPSSPDQQFTYTVSAPGRFSSPQEFEQVLVRSTSDGREVRVKDVARVELGAEYYKSFGQLNGKPAGLLLLYLLPGANQMESAEGVYSTLRELKKYFPDDVDYAISYDTTPAVKASIEEIVHTLFEAIALVVLVVFIFLQNWRATLIPLLTVPVALLGTFAVFPMLGFSVNTLSLFGMVLAIGIVVDDAIVVVEAVMHHIEQGMSPRDATVQAMKEVSGPVIGIALILASVFIPVAFLGGLVGSLYKQFALTIAIAVLISAFNALSLSPALSALLLKPAKQNPGLLGRFFKGFNRGFGATTNWYVGMAGALARRAAISLLLVAFVALGAGGFTKVLPSGFVPDEDQGIFMLNVQLPRAASLERTKLVCNKINKILENEKAVKSFNVIGGMSILTSTYTPYSASYFILLKDWSERKSEDMSLKALLKSITVKLAGFPEAIAFPFAPPTLTGFGSAGGFSLMLQDRSGNLSVKQMGGYLMEFMKAARERPELTALFTAFDPTVPQVNLQVDREKVSKLGIPVQDVFNSLQTSLGGTYVNDFNRFGRLYRVFVQSEADFRQKPEDIGQFYVRSATTGAMVPLSTLVTVRPSSGTEVTTRYNLMRAIEISGRAAPGYSSGQAMDALEEVARRVLPREMGYEFSGLSYQERTAPNPMPTFVLAIVFVFLLLAALYESWALPWSVLLGTPLVALGAMAGVWMRSLDNNVFVQIGLIMLIGLAAKNAILIVEFARMRHESGKPLVDSALESARLRFRPILMTAFAFILGVVPLVIASGSGSASRQVMGTAVFSGMLLATAAGVFIIPALFVVVESLSAKLSARKGGAVAKNGGPAGEAGGQKPGAPGVTTIVAILGGAFVLLTSGCRAGPDYKRPDVEVPGAWRAAQESAESAANIPWWTFYQDPVLTNLVSVALENNKDLKVASARIEQALGNYRAQRSYLFPSVNASGSWTRARVGNVAPVPGATGNEFDVFGMLSYEVDVWGRVRRLSEAARAQYLASEQARRTVYITLVSSVAGTYFDLLALDAQLAIARDTYASRTNSLQLTQIKFNEGKGIVSELDVRQAETQVHSARSTIAQLERSIGVTENALSFLLGRNPGSIQRGKTLSEQRFPPEIPPGLPSELLLRRPDIAAAEQTLIAANANIGAARAAYFPTISLTAALGLQSVELDDLFDSSLSHAWSFAPQVAGPIFNAGRIRAGVKVAEAERSVALSQYEQAIQNAFREVEDGLVSINKLKDQIEAEEAGVLAERKRLELSRMRYEGGVASYSDVLDAERYLFSAELDLVQARSQLLDAHAQLYKALGGGWLSPAPSGVARR